MSVSILKKMSLRQCSRCCQGPQPYPQASPLWCKQDHKGLGAFSGAGAHSAECRTGWKPEHQHAFTKEQPLALSNRGWHIDTPAPWLLEGTEMNGLADSILTPRAP